MKVSLSWMQYYSNVGLKNTNRDELLYKIGAQLGAVEDAVDYGARFDGVYIVKVVECVPHENSDHLNICKIDDGQAAEGVERLENGLVQVVCGAPNVKAGLTVAWLPPGATVPASLDESEPFVLSVRDIRGVKSNGMLASAAELGIGDDHSGLMILEDAEAKPGMLLRELYGLDDFIVDLENKMFTHRPDCFGQIGVARELAGITGQSFKSPDWYMIPLALNESANLPFESHNDIQNLVPRFAARVVQNVTVETSPVWLRSYLARVGAKPISNIVDYTNYYMLETAQPTHVFDYDKIKALSGGNPTIFPRLANEGEELQLLNGKTIKLSKDDIVIATDQKAVALAGIMGGAETEVDDNTKNIIIEAATFDMYTVRRSSMRHGLFTDAVTRFNKGQSPLQNDRVLNKLVTDICELTGARAGLGVDIKAPALDNLPQQQVVSVSVSFINTRLGGELTGEEIKRLLENVEFEVAANGESIMVRPPFWRMDIELPEDVVEEVGRLYGYDNLPVYLPARTTRPGTRNAGLEFKQKLRATLAGAGANEVLTYSFVHGDLMRKVGTDPDKFAYHIRNALSPSLQYYRVSVLPSLLEKVHPNIKSDFVRSDDNEFALFEFGKAHIKDKTDREGLPAEAEHLAFVFAADDKTAAAKYAGAPYYKAREYMELALGSGLVYEPVNSNEAPVTAPYQIGRSAVVKLDGEAVGVIGEFRTSVKKALKLPEYAAGFELDVKALQSRLMGPAEYVQFSSFPKTQADITLEVDSEVPYEAVRACIGDCLETVHGQHGYQIVMAPRDIFAAEGSDKKRLTFRLWLSHPARTLKTEEASAVLDQIAESAGRVLNAGRI